MNISTNFLFGNVNGKKIQHEEIHQEGHGIALLLSHDNIVPRVFVNSGEVYICRHNLERGSFCKFAQNCLLSVQVSPNLMGK